VAFVSLGAISDPALICTEIARVLAVPERPTISPATLVSFLHSRHMLLVLDNFEHLVVAAPGIAHLLTECAALHVLVTSRVPLNVAGEQEYLVRPLPSPPANIAMTAPSLNNFPATASSRRMG
jgi:predicted ATPase